MYVLGAKVATVTVKAPTRFAADERLMTRLGMIVACEYRAGTHIGWHSLPPGHFTGIHPALRHLSGCCGQQSGRLGSTVLASLISREFSKAGLSV